MKSYAPVIPCNLAICYRYCSVHQFPHSWKPVTFSTRIFAEVSSVRSTEGPSLTSQSLPPSTDMTPKGVETRVPAVFWTLIALQGIALIGALVGGVLARRRRLELVGLNTKLRQINSELRKRTAETDPVCSAGDEEAAVAYRQALESALGSPSAAHPYESYGEGNLSLAQARQRLAKTIREGRAAVYDKKGALALEKAEQSESMAEELKDLRASRAASRLKSSALKQVGDLRGSVKELEKSLAYSELLRDHSHDADILGEIADAYADLGDFEQAAQVYDKCIVAIQDAPTSPSVSSWDC